jgi:predicted transcriptional regulator
MLGQHEHPGANLLLDRNPGLDCGHIPNRRPGFGAAILLWKVLTAKRWEVLKAMAGQGPLTIREVARRVGRDVKAVHGDVHALIDAGLLERTETNRVAFPFDAIRVEFTLRAA